MGGQVFKEEFLPLTEKLMHYAMYKTGRQLADAENTVQTAMMKIWANINSYQPGTNAMAWAIAIMNNLIIDEAPQRRQ